MKNIYQFLIGLIVGIALIKATTIQLIVLASLFLFAAIYYKRQCKL